MIWVTCTCTLGSTDTIRVTCTCTLGSTDTIRVTCTCTLGCTMSIYTCIVTQYKLSGSMIKILYSNTTFSSVTITLNTQYTM